MYLKHIFIKNNGALRDVTFSLKFNKNDSPKPLILVGGNGSGKTNFLSLITDSLYEAAATHYQNILPEVGMKRSWFRVVGGSTISSGEKGSLSYFLFENEEKEFAFVEKAGTVEFQDKIPPEIMPVINQCLNGSDSNKFFKPKVNPAVLGSQNGNAEMEKVFSNGVYISFPSNRSETPYWLNTEVVRDSSFDTSQHLHRRLYKKIYVGNPLKDFIQWLLGLLADSRLEVQFSLGVTGGLSANTDNNQLSSSYSSSQVLSQATKILSLILENEDAKFSWVERRNPDKVVIVASQKLLLPSLHHLSAGQSILLGIFGTLLHYADISSKGMNDVVGMCVIDEIDAHMHIDLQYKVLPELVKLFPKIQFIISSHSPLFVVGMEQTFGADNIQIVELPTGNTVSAENYAEFKKALDSLSSTKSFEKKISEEILKCKKPLIMVEGKTDELYIKKAAQVLGYTSILDQCDISWVGAVENGQEYMTGDKSLKQAFKFLKANPELVQNYILILYDNDSKEIASNFGRLYSDKIPKQENSEVPAGIESLLPKLVFEERFYNLKMETKPNGTKSTVQELKKMELCTYLCECGTKEHFEKFKGIFDIIENFLEKTVV